eukprot:SM000056S17938  [mRNA]  locus=s56:241113:246286:+ [translate_table: standard]
MKLFRSRLSSGGGSSDDYGAPGGGSGGGGGGSAAPASPGALVDKATSDMLLGPDWGMNMEICDSLNHDPTHTREVMKMLRRRLTNRNPKVQLLALTVLETMVKNCGDYVHMQVAEKDILHEMVRLVKKRADMQVRDKVLELLDSWQEAFGGPGGRYPQYWSAYDELRRAGIEFPVRDPDQAAPVFTPPQTQPISGRGMRDQYSDSPQTRGYSDAGPARSSPADGSRPAGSMTAMDLKNARGSVEVLNEMLAAINPRDRGAVRQDIIVELVEQSRATQRQVMEFVSTTSNETLLAQALALNDDIQKVLSKHDAIATGSPLPVEDIPRFDAEGVEDDHSGLAPRSSARSRLSGTPAAVPPPAKLAPPPQRQLAVDLLSGEPAPAPALGSAPSTAQGQAPAGGFCTLCLTLMLTWHPYHDSHFWTLDCFVLNYGFSAPYPCLWPGPKLPPRVSSLCRLNRGLCFMVQLLISSRHSLHSPPHLASNINDSSSFSKSKIHGGRAFLAPPSLNTLLHMDHQMGSAHSPLPKHSSLSVMCSTSAMLPQRLPLSPFAAPPQYPGVNPGDKVERKEDQPDKLFSDLDVFGAFKGSGKAKA